VTGRYGEARAEFHKVADSFAQDSGLAYPISARAALWAGDAAGARDDLASLDTTQERGRAIDADRAVLQAGIAALEGRTDEALAGYRDALRTWQDLGCVWDEALVGIDMAILLDPAMPEVRAVGAAARDILVGLKAKPFIEKLDEALATGPAEAGAAVRETAPQAGVETGARAG
jgi:hypothetical protein